MAKGRHDHSACHARRGLLVFRRCADCKIQLELTQERCYVCAAKREDKIAARMAAGYSGPRPLSLDELLARNSVAA